MGRTPVHIARLSVTEDGGWEKRRVRMRILRERACPGQLGKQQPEREAAAFSCRSQLNSAAAPWSHLGCRPLTACALAGCGRSVVDPGASSRRLPPPLDGPPGTFFLVLWTPRESNRLETDERSPGLRRGSLPASTRSLAGLVQREGTPGRAREPAPKLIASEFVDRRSHPLHPPPLRCCPPPFIDFCLHGTPGGRGIGTSGVAHSQHDKWSRVNLFSSRDSERV